MSEDVNPYSKPSNSITNPELLASVSSDGNSRPSGVQLLDIHKESIIPDPNQPRKLISDDVINERCAQMEAEGQVSPITVWPGEMVNGKVIYMLFDGECRWRAALKSDSIEFLRAEVTLINQDDKFAILSQQLLHNDDGSSALTNIEKASAYYRLVNDAKNNGSENPFDDVAKALGKQPSEVSRIVSLVDLPTPIVNFSLEHGFDDPKVLVGLKQIHKLANDELFSELQLLIIDTVNENGNLRKNVASFVSNAKKKTKINTNKKKTVKAVVKKTRQLGVRDFTLEDNVLIIDTPREIFKLKLSEVLLVKLRTL